MDGAFIALSVLRSTYVFNSSGRNATQRERCIRNSELGLSRVWRTSRSAHKGIQVPRAMRKGLAFGLGEQPVKTRGDKRNEWPASDNWLAQDTRPGPQGWRSSVVHGSGIKTPSSIFRTLWRAQRCSTPRSQIVRDACVIRLLARPIRAGGACLRKKDLEM
jgi:hypothetical protein